MNISNHNYEYALGKLSFGLRDLKIKDLVHYSNEKNCLGKTFIAIKLFFSGKGIITSDRIKTLLQEKKDYILEHNPELITLFKTYRIAIVRFKEQPQENDHLDKKKEDVTIEKPKQENPAQKKKVEELKIAQQPKIEVKKEEIKKDIPEKQRDIQAEKKEKNEMEAAKVVEIAQKSQDRDELKKEAQPDDQKKISEEEQKPADVKLITNINPDLKIKKPEVEIEPLAELNADLEIKNEEVKGIQFGNDTINAPISYLVKVTEDITPGTGNFFYDQYHRVPNKFKTWYGIILAYDEESRLYKIYKTAVQDLNEILQTKNPRVIESFNLADQEVSEGALDLRNFSYCGKYVQLVKIFENGVFRDADKQERIDSQKLMIKKDPEIEDLVVNPEEIENANQETQKQIEIVKEEEQIEAPQVVEEVQTAQENENKELIASLSWSAQSQNTKAINKKVLLAWTLNANECNFTVNINGKEKTYQATEGYGDYKIYKTGEEFEFVRTGDATPINIKQLFSL